MAALSVFKWTQDSCEVDRKETLANDRSANELQIPSPWVLVHLQGCVSNPS
jgi:hypothetical protein